VLSSLPKLTFYVVSLIKLSTIFFLKHRVFYYILFLLWAPNVLTGWLPRQLNLTTITHPFIFVLVRAFLGSKYSVPAKTKGRPKGRLHSDAQVNTRAKKQNVCNSSNLRNCVPCGFSYYPLYSLGFLLFSLPALRVFGGMSSSRYYLILGQSST